MLSKNILKVLLGAALLLLIPLIAMQFSDEVNWTGGDFFVAWLLLAGAGTVYLIATRNIVDRNRKMLVGAAVAAVFFYLWAELAVGIFTNLGS